MIKEIEDVVEDGDIRAASLSRGSERSQGMEFFFLCVGGGSKEMNGWS